MISRYVRSNSASLFCQYLAPSSVAASRACRICLEVVLILILTSSLRIVQREVRRLCRCVPLSRKWELWVILSYITGTLTIYRYPLPRFLCRCAGITCSSLLRGRLVYLIYSFSVQFIAVLEGRIAGTVLGYPAGEFRVARQKLLFWIVSELFGLPP